MKPEIRIGHGYDVHKTGSERDLIIGGVNIPCDFGLIAHSDGDVPNLVIEVSERSAYSFGYLVYFFEMACACSGYMLGVNPFDQPGVESYKKNMFALLGKPGYEELRQTLSERMK